MKGIADEKGKGFICSVIACCLLARQRPLAVAVMIYIVVCGGKGSD